MRALLLIVVFVLFAGWLIHDPVPQMRTVAMMPQRVVLTADEWQAFCGRHVELGDERIDNHCTINVVVDCPPDCGVFKILQDDSLLRRVW